MTDFIAVEGQSFSTHQDWVNRAKSRLTCHPKYHNTEHDGPAKGWRGDHFTAMCFDQNGMRCKSGADMKIAAFPVWWVWPDQISALLMAEATL